MGKGDKRSRRGKIFAGSYGKTRQKPKTPAFVPGEKPAVVADMTLKEKPKAKVRKKAAIVEETVPDVASEPTPEIAIESESAEGAGVAGAETADVPVEPETATEEKTEAAAE